MVMTMKKSLVLGLAWFLGCNDNFLLKCLYGHRLETVQMQQYLTFDNIVTVILELDIVILLFIFKVIRQ